MTGHQVKVFFVKKELIKNILGLKWSHVLILPHNHLPRLYYNEKGSITETVDSTETSLTRSEYQYDNKGRIISTLSFTKANDEDGGITETHQYIYNTTGKLEKMIRKKNNEDVSVVNFSIDDKGNIIDEEEVFKNSKGKKYFYYYDDKNRLTDVVSFNDRAQRLLPDYMYEYNPQGQIKQMISTSDGDTNYFIWKYTYNDRRLRETEQCFSKEKRLLGTIQYQYK